jgi:hypothetical protein
LLDKGVLSADDEMRVLVSQHFIAPNDQAYALVTQWAGARMRDPQRGQPQVIADSFRWHREQVFRGPARHHELLTDVSSHSTPGNISEVRYPTSIPKYGMRQRSRGIPRRVAEGRTESDASGNDSDVSE